MTGPFQKPLHIIQPRVVIYCNCKNRLRKGPVLGFQVNKLLITANLVIYSVEEGSNFHIGYFRDDPKEVPVFISAYGGKKNSSEYSNYKFTLVQCSSHVFTNFESMKPRFFHETFLVFTFRTANSLLFLYLKKSYMGFFCLHISMETFYRLEKRK